MLNSTNGSEYVSHRDQYSDAKTFFKEYWMWIVFAFGFPGNVVSLFVIVRMSRDKLRTSLFLVGLLSVVDNLSIIMKIINQQTKGKEHLTETGCQFMYVIGLTLAAFANWILVVISIERFTAVMFSLRIMVLWSLRRGIIVLSVVFAFLFLVNFHLFFTVTTYKRKCSLKAILRDYKEEWFYVSSSVYAIVPATLMVVFNSLTIWKLWRSARERRCLFVRSDLPSVESRHQERQVTIMLVTLAIVFVLLTIPRCVYALVIWPMTSSDTMSHTKITKHTKSFLNTLTLAIADSNHAVNFYLYFCLVKKFREYCLSLCKRKTTPKSKVKVENAHSSQEGGSLISTTHTVA